MTKAKPPFLRTPYNYDTNQASDESGLECKDETRTKQSFKDEVNINTIVKRFGLTGQLPQNVRIPQYGDYTDILDYHTAMTVVVGAQREFAKLPANMRARFGHDPEEFVRFCLNEDNREELKKMGLIKATETPPAPPAAAPEPPPSPEPKTAPGA